MATPAFAAKTPPERPNIVLILAEGVPAWALGCYGNREVRTPQIDRLARMGTRFSYHYAASPDPAVNRGVLLTGRTPMQLGDTGSLSPEVATLEKLLAGNGYTASATDVPGAIAFLDGLVPGKTFLLTVNLPPIRPPYDGAAQKFVDLYAQTRFDTVNPEGAGAVETLRKAAAAISATDDSIGQVVDKLLQLKLLDNSLLVFCSTSGDPLSHHGLWGPGQSLYEEALVTPMIWVWHGRVTPQAARPELVSAYDLLPSLCETLTIDPPARNLCGRSYLLLATGKPLPKKNPWRSTVFARSRSAGMARVQRYKWINHEDGSPGELYSLVADPWEKVNQYENPQFVNVRDSLAAEWQAWKKQYSA